MSHRQWRLEEEGRRNSLEEENIDIDGLHRLKVFDKIKELVGELQELHKSERVKLQESQEVESQQFMEKLERVLVSFHEKQQEESSSARNIWWPNLSVTSTQQYYCTMVTT